MMISSLRPWRLHLLELQLAKLSAGCHAFPGNKIFAFYFSMSLSVKKAWFLSFCLFFIFEEHVFFGSCDYFEFKINLVWALQIILPKNTIPQIWIMLVHQNVINFNKMARKNIITGQLLSNLYQVALSFLGDNLLN